MPTLGVMLPQGRDAAGTGVARWWRQITVPFEGLRAYTESFSVATMTSESHTRGSP